ncbi:MAG: hypothetical protein KKA67_03645 [Spirochaetes bacterium]|nr:hypothetical protein [Spirochaetota bacterium]MBU1079395.1 hypothetical protein [Spirochaetota bacterium]
MNSLFILYSALAVFGVGVTIVDLFGVFEHAGSEADGGDSASDGADSASDDAFSSGDDASGGEDAGGEDAGDADSGGETDGGHDAATGHDDTAVAQHGGARGSYVASADTGTRLVAKAIGALRLGVYFSLGAGPTGLFAVFTGVGPGASLAWSAGAGVFIAALARALRSLVRKDLDSSIKPEEFIMDEATIIVPVGAGAMGKAVVRRYGRETELYVRSREPGKEFPKGSAVRIVDFDDDCYWVESP